MSRHKKKNKYENLAMCESDAPSVFYDIPQKYLCLLHYPHHSLYSDIVTMSQMLFILYIFSVFSPSFLLA